MVMMAFLNCANFSFKAQYLRSIFAGTACRRHNVTQLLCDPFRKGRKHIGMVIQIACLDELNVRMRRCDLVGEPINPIDQNAGKKKIRKYDDALVSKL